MSFVDRSSSKSSRYIGVITVIGFHILLAWVLLTGLSIKTASPLLSEVQASIIEELKPPNKLPEPPKQPQPIKKIFVPKAEIPPPPSSEPTVQTTTISTPPVVLAAAPSIAAPTPSTAPTPTLPAEIVNAKLDVSAGCQKPQYPDASRNAEEEGAVTVGFYVDVDGKVKESRIDKTSGFKRLDEAARQALSLCSFKPGTENGKPVASWAKIKYVWRLN